MNREKNKVLLIVGARPNMIKMAPLYHALKETEVFKPLILHTGQHMGQDMNRNFIRDLGLPTPHYQLYPGTTSRSARMGRMVSAIKEVINEIRPERVVVFGDVDSALAGALASREKRIYLVHIEAGLRSFDPDMPEELNRRLVDQLADELYITEESARINLLAEGVCKDRIHFVGNLMIDSWKKFAQAHDLPAGTHILWTIHRPSNTDDPESLRAMIALLKVAMRYHPVRWPLHPRTKSAIESFDLYDSVVGLTEGGRLELRGPLSYPEFTRILSSASLVVTDSGGVQEEACISRVPCITLRKNTERPVTVDVGANHLFHRRCPETLAKLIEMVLGQEAEWLAPPMWDGNAGQRIADHFLAQVGANRSASEQMSGKL